MIEIGVFHNGASDLLHVEGGYGPREDLDSGKID
jgi:hypothetical protein